MTILVVEDDARTAEALREALVEAGWSVEVLQRGDEAVQQISTQAYDAIIMDIMLPGMNGLEVVTQLRSMHNSTPVLMLSARGDVDHRISGLDAGADDYMAKPFSIGEVVARIRAIARRGGENGAILLRLADLTLDVPHRVAQRAGKSIELSPREFRLVQVLMQNAGNVCNRTMLLRLVWDYSFDPGTNLVDVYVRKLRDKIDHGHSVPLLHTVRGVGYLMSDKQP
ncbi:MAG: response regulator transcription factor [Verrucomicrobium sp.]|nr:response regulator transcription factor [Verrucomicrobium sp.]